MNTDRDTYVMDDGTSRPAPSSATPTFTPLEMRDRANRLERVLPVSTELEVALLRHGADAVEEVARLKEVCPHFWCPSCEVEAQKSDEDGCCLSCGAVLVSPNRRIRLFEHLIVPSWKKRAEAAESALAALRAVIQQELCRDFTDTCAGDSSLGRIVVAAGLWPKGEQVPHTYTPDEKLFAADALERAMADVPDMLRAEFAVVKKAIAMVEARRNNLRGGASAAEYGWLGDLLAVLRESA